MNDQIEEDKPIFILWLIFAPIIWLVSWPIQYYIKHKNSKADQ